MVYVYYGETTSEYHQIHSITKYVVLEEEMKRNDGVLGLFCAHCLG